MLKDYRDEAYGRGTGPSIQCLDKRKRCHNVSILKKQCNQTPAMWMQRNNALHPPKKTKDKKENKYGKGNACKQMTTVRFRFKH